MEDWVLGYLLMFAVIAPGIFFAISDNNKAKKYRKQHSSNDGIFGNDYLKSPLNEGSFSTGPKTKEVKRLEELFGISAPHQDNSQPEDDMQPKNNTDRLANKIHCPRYLYHFTDKRNIESIKSLGGLYSWRYMETNGFHIPKPGGNELSRSLDTRFSDWSDYVRLSFCSHHPMMNRLERNGYDLVTLKIDSDIISETSYISDINATSNYADIRRASDIDDLHNFLDFDAINNNGYIKYGTPEYALHQAEVLIKTKVPLKYIRGTINS